ncbi:MAG: sulfur carrier protein ThiS [Planctomycetota bacterium]
MEPAHLNITVNGEARKLAAPATVRELVLLLGLRPEQVAVERNKQIVRRSDHASTQLADGDHIEVVTFFGGG